MTLIFPNDQKLWSFFATAEVAEFRIDSSKNTISGRFQQEDIELAKQKFGASELKKESMPYYQPSRISYNVFSLTRLQNSFAQ